MATSFETRSPPTTDRLRELHARLGEAARTEVDVTDFFRRFLADLIDTLAVLGGAVWVADAPQPRLAARSGVDDRDLKYLERDVRNVFVEGAGRVSTPVDRDSSGATNNNQLVDSNGAQWLLYPIRIGTTICGVVAVRLPLDAEPAQRAAWQRMLVPLCDHAAQFLFRRGGRLTGSGSSHADERAEYAAEIHRYLDLRRTAAAVANETCRVIGCDRASVVLYRRGAAEALAVSGQDFLDRRAGLVRRLESLAAAVAATSEALHVPDDENAHPPQVAAPLAAYIDEAQARTLSAVPLRDSVDGDRVIGLLFVERIATAAELENRHGKERTEAREHRSWRETLEPLLPHAATALANALRYEGATFGRFLPWRSAHSGGASLSGAAIWFSIAGALFVALWLIPYDFAVEARGTLQPVVRRDVFAPIDGTIDKIFVRHGDRVQQGDPLFELRSTELDVAEADLIKQINETEQEFVNAQRQYNDGRTLSAAEQGRLVGQIATLEQRRDSLRKQAALFAEKRQRLRVASPMAGQVATWNVEELLAERPVRQGQTLTALVDPDGEWEVEIRVPEDRFGHVVEARRNAQQTPNAKPTEIVFVLASDPAREYRGRIVETHLAAEQRGEEGNVVLVRAAIDKRELAQLHPGTEARVRVECGTRTLGYVLLHDVWAFVQTRVLFKL